MGIHWFWSYRAILGYGEFVISEWCTHQAHLALELAREEARNLNHSWIGTEHLLLGLVRLSEDHDAAGPHVLSQHGALPESVRALVIEQVPDSTATTYNTDGEEPKFTPRMIFVCEHSLQIAIELGYRYVSTLHLLLGMLYEKEGIGNRVLHQLGITFGSALQSATNRPPPTEMPPPEPFMPLIRKTPGAVHILEYARQLAARDASEESVGTHHYLLATMMEQKGLAARALASLGVTYEALKAKIDDLDMVGTSDAQSYQVLPSSSEYRYGEAVVVSEDELDILVGKLPKLLPAGIPLAFNNDERGAWIRVGEGVNLEYYIHQALVADDDN